MSLRRLESIFEEFSFIHGNVFVLLVSWVLMNFAGHMPETYYSLYVLELGGTPMSVGVISFSYMMALASVQFLGGYLADSYGRKRLVVTMTFALALSYLLYALAFSWEVILVGAVLQGLFLVYQPALWAIMADSLPPERRGVGYALSQLVGVFSIASPIVAGCIVGWAGLLTGMRVMYMATVMAYLTAAVLRFRLRETLKPDAGRPGVFEVLRSYPRAVRESFTVLKVLPRTVLNLSVVYVVFHMFSWMCMQYYVIYATRFLGVSEEFWALLSAVWFASMYASTLPVGKLVDAVGRVAPLLASMPLTAVATWMFIKGGSVLLLTSFVVNGIATTMFSNAYQSLQTDLVAAEYRGRVIGFTNFFAYVFGAVGGFVGGYLYEHVHPSVPFMLLTVSQAPLLVFSALSIREPKVREE